jgi:hypothetical protein
MVIQPVSMQRFDYRLTPHLSLLTLFGYFVRAVKHRLRNRQQIWEAKRKEQSAKRKAGDLLLH